MELPLPPADFGVIGLTEECKGILLEMHDLGYVGCVYDFDHDKVEAFLENEAKDTKILGAASLEEMINNLKISRCIVLLIEDIVIDNFVDVGFSIDDFIEERLLPHLSYRDYVIDTTSSGAEDSKKRVDDFRDKGIRYVGIKNGASVALLQGICICLENNRLWNASDVRSMLLRSLENKAPPAGDDKSCCCWGFGGQESYVDFVVTEMSNKNELLMREVDRLLSTGIDLLDHQRGIIYRDWSRGHLNSAFFDRFTPRRTRQEIPALNDDQRTFVGHVKKAALACQVINYARGFASIREVAEMHQWDLDFADIKPEWPIDYRYKSAFYRNIRAAFKKNPRLSNLLLVEDFAKMVDDGLPSIKEVIAKATSIPLNIVDDKMEFRERVEIQIRNDAIKKITVDEFTDALEYYEDFRADAPLCRKLLDKQVQSEEPTNELDVSSLHKYQYQLRELFSTIVKIEDTIEKLNKDFGADDNTKKFRMDYNHSLTRKKLIKLHTQPHAVYEACMKHMEKDEKTTALHGVLTKKLDRVLEISKMYIRENILKSCC